MWRSDFSVTIVGQLVWAATGAAGGVLPVCIFRVASCDSVSSRLPPQMEPPQVKVRGDVHLPVPGVANASLGDLSAA
jgi:hypothetical protein